MEENKKFVCDKEYIKRFGVGYRIYYIVIYGIDVQII